MTHRGFSEGVRCSLILVAGLILGGCSGSSKVPATPGCFHASDCKDPLQCVQLYCVAACEESRDCPNGERCIKATEGNTCQPPETATCQYTSQCTKPLVCSFDQQCRDQCQKDIDCPTGQKCTSVTHLCADPTIDKNYDPATNEFRGAPDGGTGGAGGGSGGVGGAVTGTGGSGAGGGSGASDAGVDAAVANPGDDSGAGGGSSGGSDASVDAPVTNPGDSGTDSGGSGDATSSNGGDGRAPDATATSCTGHAPTNFGHVASSNSDSHYTSGVGLLTSTEFLAFNAYVGPDSTDGGVADGGTGLVNRIDVQHFDLVKATSKGSATPLLTAAGDGSGLYVNGAAIAPTGEIAIVYAAATASSWGVYLAFLDKDLALNQTTQLVALGSDYSHNQSHVEWVNGTFVASSVVGGGPFTIKMAKFRTDGSNAGSTSAIPTDDPSGFVYAVYNPGESQVAFSGSTFAIGYFSTSTQYPSLTLVDEIGAEVGVPVSFPSGVQASNAAFVAVAGTSQGFVAVYDGTSSSNTHSLLATFVSNSASGDAGVVPVGATYAFTGGYAYLGPWAASGSSDGIGAGFAVLYPDGSVSFLFFSGDGSTRTSPQAVLQQVNAASGGDETHITNFGGNFAVSLYSSAEHLTRVVASSCQ